MRTRNTYRKRALIKAIVLLIIMVLPPQLFAEMSDYCVMPPYVKTDVQPNIMIVMDNAKDMNEPVYCDKDASFSTNYTCHDEYVPSTPYDGYFKRGLKYTYTSANGWKPDINGIYSGNLLNWATASKYDYLQNILVGGISTSRQSNVNTLISKSNTWIKTLNYSIGPQTYTCIFKINNANVEITEPTPGACGYLDSPIAHPISGDPMVSYLPGVSPPVLGQAQHDDAEGAEGRALNPFVRKDGFWSRILSTALDLLIPSAEAAQPQPQLRISGGPSALPDGTECTAGYNIAISASGGTGTGYLWSISSGSLPPGLALGASGTPSTAITGTPSPGSGGTTYNFTVRVTDSAGNTDTKSYSIAVLNATVSISLNSPLPDGYVSSLYLLYLQTAASSVCGSYTWSVTSGSLPPGLYLDTTPNVNYLEIYGTPTAVNTYTFTLQVKDSGNNVASKSITLTIMPAAAGLSITTGSPLANGIVGQYYVAYIFTQQDAPGATYPITWSLIAGSFPPGLSFGYYGGSPSDKWSYGYLYGNPTIAGTYTFTLKVVDSFGIIATKDFAVTIDPAPTIIRTTGNLDVKICIGDYTTNCTTAGHIGGGGALKSGLIDSYWTKARFGVMDFIKDQNVYSKPEFLNYIEQDPGIAPDPNFLTAVENAVGIDPTTVLVNGEYEAVNYYKTEINPIRDPYVNAKSCTKNFILMLTSGIGADNPPNPAQVPAYPVGSEKLFNTAATDYPAACKLATLSNLAKNACYGFNHEDLRPSDKSGRQYVGTYIVNTMGTKATANYDSNNAPVTTGDILKQAAVKGGGSYYEVSDPESLKGQLEQALQDIIKRAAAGTAASVLASGEGSGANLIQAVFYPRRKFGDTEIAWIGRLTNLWYYVDPRFSNSTIREDDGDRVLNLKTDETHHDYITSLYFSGEATMATRWTDTNGDGGVDGAPLTPDIEFENLGSLWEAGKLLWSRNTNTFPRTIYTACVTGTTCIPTQNMALFSTGNKTPLMNYLQAGSDAESEAIIRYVHGEDTPFSPSIAGFTPSYRSRTVSINGVGPYTWKLGDVLNSTPKISTWLPLNPYHKINKDTTYGQEGQDPSLSDPADVNHFITTSAYKNRGMIFAGANDGMLHAFKLGTLELKWSGQLTTEKARLTGSDLGKEMWAFIPKNVLPYLKYTADPDYCHIYSVDLSPFIFDASIGANATDGPTTDKTPTSWRTILIGGMRYGGSCKPKVADCSASYPNGVCAPTVVGTETVGYSSYFALDVTEQENPKLLWEFSHPDLGFTTAGPAIVRISSLTGGVPDNTKNGHWFVVLASGPTGPITKTDAQFLASSDQQLSLFILNLKDGTIVKTIPTGISEAFAGSLYNSTMDTDLDYQDDVIYIPYVKSASTGTNWTDGGVLRLSTKENSDVNTWDYSTVIKDVGPVTSSITKLQNKSTNTLWLFFGTGRYFYESETATDDGAGQRHIFGLKEPCYSVSGFDGTCTTSRQISDLKNVANIADVPTNPDDSLFKGWYIPLDADAYPDPTMRAERVVTDPLAATTGVVFFTTYKPYRDPCALGGRSYIWAVKYNSGGDASTLLKGKAIIQVSTGSIEQIDLAKAFTDKGGRRSSGMEGVPPTAQGLSIMTTPPAAKRVIHIKER